MKVGQMGLAWAIVRYRRMVAKGLPPSQRECAMKYAALIRRHFNKLDSVRQRRVLDMADFFGEARG